MVGVNMIKTVESNQRLDLDVCCGIKCSECPFDKYKITYVSCGWYYSRDYDGFINALKEQAMDKWFVRVPNQEISAAVQSELFRKGYRWPINSKQIENYGACQLGSGWNGSGGHYITKTGSQYTYHADNGVTEISIADIFTDRIPDLTKPDLPDELPPIKTKDALLAMKACGDVKLTFMRLWPDLFKE